MWLAARGVVDHEAWWAHVAERAVTGMEEVGRGWVRRAVPGATGPCVVTVHASARGAWVEVDAGDGDVSVVVTVVRRWLGLDDDPAEPVGAWAGDPVLGGLVDRRPGLRVHGCADPAELALRTVLGQQVSVAAARTTTARLVALLGEPVGAAPARPGEQVGATGRPGCGPVGAGLRAFPDPAAVAAAGADVVRSIGLTGARAATVVALAAALADGLDVGPGPDLPVRLATLRALPGIGPWTVAYVALRAGGDPDAFPAHDLVLRQRLGAASAREAEARGDAWRPHRALAAQHLWTSAALGA